MYVYDDTKIYKTTQSKFSVTYINKILPALNKRINKHARVLKDNGPDRRERERERENYKWWKYDDKTEAANDAGLASNKQTN